MATIRQYAIWVRATVRQVARRQGFQLDADARPLRAIVSGQAAVTGVLLKLLVTKGVITDAEIQAALTSLADDDVPEEPTEPTPPTT